MGLLDGIIGGIVGAEINHLVRSYIEQHGGVAALVKKFEEQGMGSLVASWVGTGANHAVTGQQIQQALGSGALQQLAAKFGMNADDIANKLAAVLPQVVDQMTPNGTVPPAAMGSAPVADPVRTA